MFARLFNDPLSGLPSRCAVCHAWQQHRICSGCVALYARPRSRCRRCGLGLPESQTVCGTCLRDPPPFDATTAAVDYAFPWDRLIGAMKFRGRLDLVAAMAERLSAAVAAVAAAGGPLPNLLLPAPLSPARLRTRGYNQAWELARRLGRRLRLEARHDILWRVRDTAAQHTLPTEARARNVRGAFAVPAPLHARLHGRSVALIDDVMTTGATAREMAATLRQAGATTVQVWVVARTP